MQVLLPPGPPAVSRRVALVLSGACFVQPQQSALAAPPPSALSLFSLPPSAPKPNLVPSFAQLLLQTVDEVAAASLPSAPLDVDLQRFQARERKYANLPAQCDGSPRCLNWELYCRGKVFAPRLSEGLERDVFAAELGRALCAALPPTPHDSFVAALPALLQSFVDGGYCRSYLIELNTLPGLPDAPGWTARGESSVVGSPDEPLRRLQIRLAAPADIEGGIALRAEENGWRLRLVAEAVTHLAKQFGFAATADETFFQDAWTGPPALGDKLLLALGDPFFSVQVPFVPDTLVLDLRLTRHDESSLSVV